MLNKLNLSFLESIQKTAKEFIREEKCPQDLLSSMRELCPNYISEKEHSEIIDEYTVAFKEGFSKALSLSCQWMSNEEIEKRTELNAEQFAAEYYFLPQEILYSIGIYEGECAGVETGGWYSHNRKSA